MIEDTFHPNDVVRSANWEPVGSQSRGGEAVKLLTEGSARRRVVFVVIVVQ